ncbi:MAG: peptidoglycan-binding protein [Verrucomicrobiota bacterium]|nr:peptidoglycan-binding protein [Verrucomicrobiota bacterium]
MNSPRIWLIALACVCGLSPAFGSARDPLAPRDSWGLLHQMPWIEPTDYEPREPCRFFYYSKSRTVVEADPAYVGALQVALRRNGYYCGPIDGVFSDDVSEAIAKLQKAYRMRVNGALTVAVRRSLHLP